MFKKIHYSKIFLANFKLAEQNGQSYGSAHHVSKTASCFFIRQQLNTV